MGGRKKKQAAKNSGPNPAEPDSLVHRLMRPMRAEPTHPCTRSQSGWSVCNTHAQCHEYSSDTWAHLHVCHPPEVEPFRLGCSLALTEQQRGGGKFSGLMWHGLIRAMWIRHVAWGD